MKNKSWSLLAMLLAVLLVLAACSDSDDSTKEEGSSTPKGEEEAGSNDASLSLSVENEGDAIEGGVLQVALVKDEPFQGIFSWELYDDGYDSELMNWSSNVLFETDGEFKFTDEGIASLEVDEENLKATVKIREGVKWSDGEPLKIEDLILPYEIIADPDYEGVRYDGDFQNIVGAEEFHAGTAETISGLKKIDETTLEISFKKLSPAVFYGGDGLWAYAAPSHLMADIPVADLLAHDLVRKNPVTLGAFKFDKVVPGESVQFVANEHYWKGKPKLDGVLVKVVPPSSISVAMKEGKYDLAQYFNATQWQEIKDLDNIDILGRQELYYSYLSFKLGKYDTANKQVVSDFENSKMGDVELRKAMGYALNIEEVSEVYYNGLRERANSMIPPVFSSFFDDSLEGYTYDEAKAIEILDAAGYKDVDGDGMREDKNGQPLEIRLAAMSGDQTQEDIISYYLQNWKDVGLNVVLTTGRLIDFNSFYDKVRADDPEIDVFMGAWGTGTNPSPFATYSGTSANNLGRYTTEELETILNNIDSPEAMDSAYRSEQFRAYQEYMEENAVVIPMQFRYELFPVNKRVKNYKVDYNDATGDNLQEIELVAEEPIAGN
ncbi:oligopeptide ABC transporter substrate-binding protein [Lysinibacillus sp. 3P01SB]|uniref:oligopeptide ABC transporter substrate-binding protein n=1 Tax=Lysinibacillus sp. 3P01SB TaxID=3132284 RepID=UPI0039A4F20B